MSARAVVLDALREMLELRDCSMRSEVHHRGELNIVRHARALVAAADAPPSAASSAAVPDDVAEAGAHVLSEWLNDNAPIGECRYIDPARETYAKMLELDPRQAELLSVIRALSIATDEGDDASQGTHYADKAGRIRCKGSFLDLIERARRLLAPLEQSADGGSR